MPTQPLELRDPWLLLLAVPAVLIVWWRYRGGRGAPAVIFPTVARLRGLRPTTRQRLRHLVPLLELAALLALIVAASRPRVGNRQTIVRSEGIAIQMVVDRSSSMEEPMRYGKRERKRIEIVKDVFEKFVSGDDELAGRTTDLIGLTTFARYTEESCPLVSQHQPLVAAVQDLRTVTPALNQYDQPISIAEARKLQQRGRRAKRNPLDGTAIGDAIYRAVLSLVAAEEDLEASEKGEEPELEVEGLADSGDGYRITAKIIILLTDGDNNVGMSPEEAARYAAENDIRIYYVLFTEPVERQRSLFGGVVKREIPVAQLLATPRKIAEETGGRAWLAASGDELRDIYEEIDRLERSEIGKVEFLSYDELFQWPLAAGLVAAVLAFLLAETVFRRIP